MRTVLLVVVLAVLLVPSLARSHGPRSLAVDAGWASGSSAELPDRYPVALSATWWLLDELDVGARVAWAAAAQPAVRAPDAVLEAGVAARQGIARWSAVRLQATVAAARLLPIGGAVASNGGWRLSAGGAVEAFVGRDVSLSLGVERGVLLGGGGASAAVTVRLGAYY